MQTVLAANIKHESNTIGLLTFHRGSTTPAYHYNLKAIWYLVYAVDVWITVCTCAYHLNLKAICSGSLKHARVHTVTTSKQLLPVHRKHAHAHTVTTSKQLLPVHWKLEACTCADCHNLKAIYYLCSRSSNHVHMHNILISKQSNVQRMLESLFSVYMCIPSQPQSNLVCALEVCSTHVNTVLTSKQIYILCVQWKLHSTCYFELAAWNQNTKFSTAWWYHRERKHFTLWNFQVLIIWMISIRMNSRMAAEKQIVH